MRKQKNQKKNKINVLLLENINKLGLMGDVVSVKRGYGYNFLIKDKAIIATKKALEFKNDLINIRNKRTENEVLIAKEKFTTLNDKSLKILMNCDEKENMYGSVTTNHIIKAILEQYSIGIKKSDIENQIHLKNFGDSVINLTFAPNIKAEMKLTIDKIKKMNNDR